MTQTPDPNRDDQSSSQDLNQEPAQSSRDMTQNSKNMAQLISALLVGGLGLAVLIVIAGEILALSRHAHEIRSYHIFSGEPHDIKTIRGVIRDCARGESRGIMQLGVLILMATPIARVALAAFSFGMEGDKKYVLISGLVLVTLLFALFSGL